MNYFVMLWMNIYHFCSCLSAYMLPSVSGFDVMS